MTYLQLTFLWIIAIVLLAHPICAQTKDQYKFSRNITLESSQKAAKVPAKRIWKIEKLSPYQSEKGIGTADLYINGQLFIGQDRAYTVFGKFDITINTKQSSPIWVLEDSEVQVGDSRGRVSIKEYIVQE